MSNSWLDEQIMMTLSGIAYYGDVSGQLKNPTYATQNDWSLVWGPVDDWYGNRAYAALSASTGKYAVAVRGTDTDFGWDAFINMYNDLNVLWQVEWDYFFAGQGAMVSQGTYTQLSYLLDHATWDGQTLAQFIEGIPAKTPIAVTGHSLGGNLATVLGAWKSFKRGPHPIRPTTAPRFTLSQRPARAIVRLPARITRGSPAASVTGIVSTSFLAPGITCPSCTAFTIRLASARQRGYRMPFTPFCTYLWNGASGSTARITSRTMETAANSPAVPRLGSQSGLAKRSLNMPSTRIWDC